MKHKSSRMKRIAILRHAKSSWGQPGLDDFQRPLNRRGAHQCEILANYLADNVAPFDQVVCSPAERTRETLRRLSLDGGNEPYFEQRLYLGPPDHYLDCVWSADDTANSLLIVGHNPASDELARYLAKPNGDAYRSLMAAHFGTANLAVLMFDGDWRDVGEASCTLTTFFRPDQGD